MEVKPDWGNDSGVFFRTTETGAAYQITMDYLPGGSMGRFISEGGFQFGAGRGAAPDRRGGVHLRRRQRRQPRPHPASPTTPA